MKSKVLIFLFLIVLLFSGCDKDKEEEEIVDGDPFAGEVKTLTSNATGTLDGYDYEFWKNSTASGTMTVGSKGAFKCEWTSNGSGSNILFRSGKRFNATPQTYDKVGNITISYTADEYTPNGTSYLSVYGWLYTQGTTSNMVEYYIVDNYHGSYHPGMSGTEVADSTFTIPNEGTYKVYTRKMTNAPAIAGGGNYNFTQYISVRQEKRLSGTISVSEHFKKWNALGLDMSANLYEAMMKVEGYNSSGKAKITKNTLTVTK